MMVLYTDTQLLVQLLLFVWLELSTTVFFKDPPIFHVYRTFWAQHVYRFHLVTRKDSALTLQQFLPIYTLILLQSLPHNRKQGIGMTHVQHIHALADSEQVTYCNSSYVHVDA